MESQYLDDDTTHYLQLVAKDFEVHGTFIYFYLKPQWKAKANAQYTEPYILDLGSWPTRAEVTLLSEGPPIVKSLREPSIGAVIFSTLQLISPLVKWPALPESLARSVNQPKVIDTIVLSDSDEVEENAPHHDETDLDEPSQSEEYAEFDSDMSFDEPDEVDEVMDEIDEELCPELKRDINNYQDLFGEDRIAHKYSIGRNMTDLTFTFDPAEHISQPTADAWGVSWDLPIAACIRISASQYRENTAPRVEIWQPGAKTSEDEIAEEVKAAEELQRKGRERELELRQLHYPNGVPTSEVPILADMVAKSVPGYSPGPITPPKARPYNPGRFGLQTQLKTIMDAFLVKHWPSSAPLSDSLGFSTLSAQDEAGVKQLTEMGYPRGRAIRAWRASSGTHHQRIEASLNFLLDPLFVKNSFHSAQSSSQQPQQRRRRRKAQVDWSAGFLVAFGSYFAQRFATVHEYCVICDLPHIGVGGALLKPCVCARDLCAWSFQQLGVGADASTEIATQVDVTDLLVSMVVSAAKSPRKDHILEPFPTVFDPNNSSKPVLSPQVKDWELLNTIITAICSVNLRTPLAWRQSLQQAHPLAWPLLNWITSSNRSHLVRLPPAYFLNSMHTPYQYLLISAPPEKEAIFQRNKKQYGSRWAFHGSNPENWHSIFRRGLLNASGTNLQLNGAAYGAGIYLSPAAQTSFGYSRMGVRYHAASSATATDSLQPQDTNYCIALCEVVNNQLTENGDIWVQKEPDNVVTRIFFVYPNGGCPSQAMNNHCSQPNFVAEAENAAKFYVSQTGDYFEDDEED